MSITGLSEQWVAAWIKQKGDSKCIPWKSLRDLILAHPNTKKRVDVFTLSIYGLVIFPKALGHIDDACHACPGNLAETFRSLSACRRAGKGRFTECAQLLLAWFHSPYWKVEKVSCRVLSENYSLLKEFVATPRRHDTSKEKWMAILHNLQEEDVEWRAPWMISDQILYRYRDFEWVLYLDMGAIRYALLLVLGQYRSRQFISATQGLAQCEFAYKGDNYKKKGKRVNDNVPLSNRENTRPIEEHLQVIPSELEIIKQYFGKRSSELGKKIEQLEEEKIQLGLDVDIQKLKAEKMRKGKNKADEDLDSLKIDYKKLRLSMRTSGLGKTSEKWRQ
ncbi:myosin heavy chain-like [Gossypium australe]|uniref:Myosin heavy chain-like n=1 Tax=Gossypium australe TaxID=47621 RepID=A0A5B6VY80_9ROSI|nr:myosin heavy chain-like [Gossypium australe]